MDPRLQRRIQRYGWDKAASVYEQHWREHWREQLAPAQRVLIEMAMLKRGERVLDVACGTGLVTFPAADAVGASGSVAAADLSDAMVAHVAAEAHTRNLRHVAPSRMDAERLEFPDASFDAVLCALGLMYVPDREQRFAKSAACSDQVDVPRLPCGALATSADGRKSSRLSTAASSPRSARCSFSLEPPTCCGV